MPDRLAELVRQRALLQEHLAWLNREIDQATPASAPRASSLSGPQNRTPPHGSLTLPEEVAACSFAPERTATANDIFAEYRVPPAAMKDEVRKGCFLYFSAALVLLFVVVTILYFALRST